MEICSITITTTFAYDVGINKNYDEIDIENLGTPFQYVSVLVTYCTMYFAFIVLCTYLKIWNLFTNLSLIISMIFWTSTINLMFTKALIDNLKLRCNECDGDKLENHHLYMIIHISTGILCFSVVSLLLISQKQFRRYKRIGPPPLKKVNLPKSKDTKYKLNMSTNNRKSIINKKIVLLADTKNIDINKAAIFIKKRMNVLRIFHKNKNPLFCQMITNDMKYIDKKYLDSKAKTKDIC